LAVVLSALLFLVSATAAFARPFDDRGTLKSWRRITKSTYSVRISFAERPTRTLRANSKTTYWWQKRGPNGEVTDSYSRISRATFWSRMKANERPDCRSTGIKAKKVNGRWTLLSICGGVCPV
jgi:hypothetical protein